METKTLVQIRQTPLKVTAHLASPIAVFDDYSPSLDSLLEWLILDRLHLTVPNPSTEQVEETREIVDQQMPLLKSEIGGEWYWAVSSPCYQIITEQTDRYRKRWSPGIDSPEPNWGKRKAKWSTSEGAEKSYDLPLYLRSTPVIHWFVVGDRDGILDLLKDCAGIGKKRSIGYGQILKWEVQNCGEDWHLWRDGQLTRPVPLSCLPSSYTGGFTILNWGWRPPAWLHSNRVRCAMPTCNVKRASVG